MPLQFLPENDASAETIDETILFDETGDNLNPHAAVLMSFIESVDFGDLFDHPEIKDAVLVRECYAREVDGNVVECDANAEGAFKTEVEYLDGDQVIEAIDMDDLYGMFKHFAIDAVSEDADTLAGKLRVATVADMLDEADLNEAGGPFKKGDFKKIHDGKLKTPSGKTGRRLVNRMTLAMFHKGAIQRAPKGSGYRKGQWNKDPAGYGEGSPSGLKKYAQYKSQHASKLQQAAKKVKGYKGTMKVTMKAAVKKGVNAAKVKAAAKGKSVFAKGKKVAESQTDVTQQPSNLTEAEEQFRRQYATAEGATLAGRVMRAGDRAAGKKPEPAATK